MKTIGIIGGMSWHSTALYYKLINEQTQKMLGGLHSAKIILASVDFAEIAKLQADGDWEKSADILSKLAQKLEHGGADFLLIATNTMHAVADQVQQSINIPLLHLADATADAIISAGYTKAGLLGTRFTMEMDYYRNRLEAKGLTVLVPQPDEITRINNVIFDELCFGTIKDDSKQDYLRFIDSLQTKGAECIIEGCTEITILIQQKDTSIPLFDTTAIHAKAAVDLAFQ